MLLNVWESQKLLLVTFATLMIVSPSISQLEEGTDHVKEFWGSTDIKISQIKYKWTVSNLKLCCHNVGEFIESPRFFNKSGCNWYLRLYPKGSDESKKDYLGLYLFSDNCTTTASFKLSLLTAKQEETEIGVLTHEYTSSTNSWGFSEFVLRSNILDPKKNLFPDNKLTINCEINATVGMENNSGNSSQPKRRLVEDLGLLFENEVFSDVTLIAGGKQFKAHKAVLAARSPIFKTMFEKDATNAKVEITDVDHKAFGEMLRYIYTDETPNLEKVATNLLIAAENYQLDELKAMCEEALHENLSIDNAVDYLILGDKHRAVNLKMEAKKFIVAHASVIKNTTSFKSLIKAQPRLALEIFKLLG